MQESEKYAGKLRWNKPQPTILPTVKDYLEAAYARRPLYASIVTDFSKALGPGVRIIEPNVKTEDSAERKLWDRTSSFTGRVEMIGDYLRARIFVPVKPGNTAQLSDSIDALISHPLATGYKDLHFRPNRETGWRCAVAQLEVDGLHSELQIVAGHPAVRDAAYITEGLRNSERFLRDAEVKLNGLVGHRVGDEKDNKNKSKMLTRAEATIQDIRDIRSAVHNFAFASSGANVMVDSEQKGNFVPVEKTALLQMFRDAGRKYFGSTIAVKMPEVQNLLTYTPVVN